MGTAGPTVAPDGAYLPDTTSTAEQGGCHHLLLKLFCFVSGRVHGLKRVTGAPAVLQRAALRAGAVLVNTE